jgi:hypothetical protein
LIRVRQHGSRCVANALGLNIPYGLRSTIQPCKGLRCFLTTKSDSIANWPAMAAMAPMGGMAGTAVVLGSSGIRNYRIRMTHRQHIFWKSTVCSLAGVQDRFGLTHSEKIGSPTASSGCVRGDFVTSQLVASQASLDIQYGIGIVNEK